MKLVTIIGPQVKDNEKFKYVKPTIEYEEQAIKFIEEFKKYNSNINGVGGLDRYIDNYSEWLKKLDEDRNRVSNEIKVKAETNFLVRTNDNKIIGMSNIRLDLNDKLKKLGGNIGYCIRPTERGKGYNKINLYLALQVCFEQRLEKIILDCDINNPASENTMKALDGLFIKEFIDDRQRTIHRYEIDVEKSIINNKNKYEKYLIEEELI